MVTRALLLSFLLAACGDPCPQDLPASCPATAPSYASDIQPLIARNCLMCHGPGGVSQDVPLDSYAAVHARRSEVLSQVYSCRMPEDPQPQLSDADRKALLTWLVCGAPDN